MTKKKIAIFASGTGSNAQKIVEQASFLNYEVALIVSNKPSAPVLSYAKDKEIDSYVISRDVFYNTEEVVSLFNQKDIDLIVLAGFLWLIPNYLVVAFSDKIINIHPSLLPKYGGKGMYGMNVHQAVFQAQENESGMTIHLVNEEYDKGKILLQEKTDISTCQDAAEVAQKVLQLEHKFFAKTIANYIAQLVD